MNIFVPVRASPGVRNKAPEPLNPGWIQGDGNSLFRYVRDTIPMSKKHDSGVWGRRCCAPGSGLSLRNTCKTGAKRRQRFQRGFLTLFYCACIALH